MMKWREKREKKRWMADINAQVQGGSMPKTHEEMPKSHRNYLEGTGKIMVKR